MNLIKLSLLPIMMLVFLNSMTVTAQEAEYKWNIGGDLGISGYLGEYSGTTPFSKPGFSFAVHGSYIYDVRWQFSANISLSGASGSVKSIKGAYPQQAKSSFTAFTTQIDAMAEFNFLPYGIGETYKGLKRWTPFIGAGIGVVAAKPDGESLIIAPELPLAIGVRYKFKPRFDLYARFTITKTFSDKVDGADGLYGIKSDWFKNTDWLCAFSIGISYEFGQRCQTCHYVE